MNISSRLKAARKHAKLTQAQLAELVGVDQTSISDIETGRSATSGRIVSMARYCGVDALWLAEGEGEMLPVTVKVSHVPEGLNDEYAFVPVLSARAAAGAGYDNHHVEEQGTLAFRREWMQRQHLKEKDLRLIRADGESMRPHINDGDMLLLDISETAKEVHSGNVYAIRRPDFSISIKRLVQTFTGEWVIVSDNPDKAKYRDESVSDLSAVQVPIVGKVCWRGGMI